MKGAVFMDRDGTISEEVGYLNELDQLRLIPKSVEAIKLINESGLMAIVITNQSGVARGYFTEEAIMSHVGYHGTRIGEPYSEAFIQYTLTLNSFNGE